jgi:ATP-dependent RNA helicase SUPV3L1/SUV3
VVEGEVIGQLDGFRFTADARARAGEQRLLLAAAERHLVRELAARAARLAACADTDIALAYDGSGGPRLLWQGARVARLRPGRDALTPRVETDRAIAALSADDRRRVQARLDAWLAGQIAMRLAPLVQLDAARAELGPAARGLVVQLVEGLGILDRASVAAQLAGLTRADRLALGRAGVRLGPVHLFIPALLRPEPTRWRLALWAASRDGGRDSSSDGATPVPLPPPGRVSLTGDTGPADFLTIAGYWPVGRGPDSIAVRIDMVDRLARQIHGRRDGRAPFQPDPAWAASLGLSQDGLARLLRALGYRPRLVDGAPHFSWAGRHHSGRRGQAGAPDPSDPVPAARRNDRSPFAILAGMKGG